MGTGGIPAGRRNPRRPLGSAPAGRIHAAGSSLARLSASPALARTSGVGMPPHTRPSPPGGTVRCRSVVGASACWTDSHPSGPLVRDVGRASPLPSGLVREGCLPVGRDPSPPIDCAPVCGWPAKLQGGSAWNWCCGHGGIGSKIGSGVSGHADAGEPQQARAGRKVGRSPPKAEPPACGVRPAPCRRGGTKRPGAEFVLLARWSHHRAGWNTHPRAGSVNSATIAPAGTPAKRVS